MVGEERLATTGRTENELVAVGRDTTFHRLIANIQVDRFTSKAVNHFDTEWGQR